jgi:hypothetical protein
MSLRRAQNICMPGNINSIVILIGESQRAYYTLYNLALFYIVYEWINFVNDYAAPVFHHSLRIERKLLNIRWFNKLFAVTDN